MSSWATPQLPEAKDRNMANKQRWMFSILARSVSRYLRTYPVQVRYGTQATRGLWNDWWPSVRP